ncbi:MAG TPA: acyl-CoA dehydrogenase [Deltaproteobacteria bacterium]|nr:acyl-CoA dehydrogenase [Deltaproteobacteria bacterium]
MSASMSIEDRLAVRETCRSFLEERSPVSHARAIMDDGPGVDPILWKEMAELGWCGALIPEDFGGSGLDLEFIVILMEETGRQLAPCPIFASALLATSALLEAGNDELNARLLPELAAGTRIGTVALSDAGAPPDGSGVSIEADEHQDIVLLSGSADFIPDLHVADFTIVAARRADRTLGFYLLDHGLSGVERTPRRMADLTRRLGRLQLKNVELPRSAELVDPSRARRLAGRLTDLACLGLAGDCAGGAQKLLEASVAFAKTRFQFDRPIGSFQAVKHRLADMYVLTETCSAATARACRRLLADPESSTVASLAKSIASDSYFEIAESAIRIHGAVGLTWEYDQHLYLKRAQLNQRLFGDSSWHRDRMLSHFVDREPTTEQNDS